MNELIKGNLRSVILKLLTDRDKLYGYEITQTVLEMTGSRIRLTFGALYPVLHKLEAEGILRAENETVDNRIRKYYSLTPAGRKEAGKKITEFRDYLDTMKNIFTP